MLLLRCKDCGVELAEVSKKGRKRIRCKPCTAVYRKEYMRKFWAKRREEKPQLECRKCGTPLERRQGAGRQDQRCRPCAQEHRRIVVRRLQQTHRKRVEKRMEAEKAMLGKS